MELYIVCASGLEELLVAELESMGIPVAKKGFRGVYVTDTMENVYRINYESRIAIRVLKPLLKFHCKDAKALYEEAKKIDWALYLHPSQTFSIDPNVSHPLLRNSLFAAQTLKDAICDQLRDKLGARPSISTSNPDVQLNLFIHQNQATISFDTSGMPLYKRGYRQKAPSSQDEVQAPIQESLAAAILSHVGYDESEILCDPCCGTGTFLIEAAMRATRTPSGFYRSSWCFTHLPEYREEEWLAIKKTADNKIIALTPGKIFGSDRDSLILDHCKRNIAAAGFEGLIELHCSDIASQTTPEKPSLILCNPPYGERIPLSSRFYHYFGEFVRRNGAKGCRSFLLAPLQKTGKNGVEQTALSIQSSTPFSNGGIDTLLHAFQLTSSSSPSIGKIIPKVLDKKRTLACNMIGIHLKLKKL